MKSGTEVHWGSILPISHLPVLFPVLLGGESPFGLSHLCAIHGAASSEAVLPPQKHDAEKSPAENESFNLDMSVLPGGCAQLWHHGTQLGVGKGNAELGLQHCGELWVLSPPLDGDAGGYLGSVAVVMDWHVLGDFPSV